MLASPRPPDFSLINRIQNVSILLRMLASPRHGQRYSHGRRVHSFNPTQDACFPTTKCLQASSWLNYRFQSYSGCLLPHDNYTHFSLLRPFQGFNPTQDACFPTTSKKIVQKAKQNRFNPTQDACFPTTTISLYLKDEDMRFNPTQDACFPTTQKWNTS